MTAEQQVRAVEALIERARLVTSSRYATVYVDDVEAVLSGREPGAVNRNRPGDVG